VPFAKYHPRGPLARYVESMWFLSADAGRGGSGRLLMLPSGRIDLVITLDGATTAIWGSPEQADDPAAVPQQGSAASLRLLGSTSYVVGAEGQHGAVGISFKAHGLRAFTLCRDALGDHAGTLCLPLAHAWQSPVDSWIERLQQAATPAAMFQLLEGMLWSTLRAPPAHAEQIEHAVTLLSDPFTPRRVSAVAEDVRLGRRQFEHLFREHTGLTPKTFARVMRLRSAAQLMRRRGAGRWTDAAALCHYSDQAHLVREFRQLAGMTPTAYLALPGSHATCLPWSPWLGPVGPRARAQPAAAVHLFDES
jgi:AraC-like DNA-binding protein